LLGNSYSPEEHIEYPPYDGWYNNFAHPDWGAAGKLFQLYVAVKTYVEIFKFKKTSKHAVTLREKLKRRSRIVQSFTPGGAHVCPV